MATCRYFQQGNCRSGQYCRFAHTYNVNYGENSSLGNKPAYTKTVACAVAEEVLAVERGGQWLLSCFGPFKERPCIPGMEDLSPDEFHWEIYQAQKSGTVDQTKAQFQQLCQEMKAKLAVLKNPTQEIVAMLESLQKGGQDSSFGASNTLTKPSNFSFATPQLAVPSTSASVSNLFTSKPFNASNPFGGGTSTFGPTGSTPFAFSNPPNAGISSPFGAKPTFGSNPVFGSTASPAPAFAGAVQSPTSVFTGANQTGSTFGAAATQNVSAFNAQPAFGQPAGFNTSTQESTPFGRPPTQSNAIFGGTTTLTNSVFGGAASAQPGSSIFGGSQPATTPLFGGTTQQTSSSVFGGSAAPGNPPLGSVASSPFAQPKTGMTFGGGPVFGGAPAFGGQANPGIFGGQATFAGAPASSSSIFGGSTASPNFGTFGSVVKSPTSTFGGTQNPPPFGATVSTNSSPFVTSAVPFSTTTASTPFSGSSLFGSIPQSVEATAGFGAAPKPADTPFGTANVADASPFGQGPFGAVSNSSPFSNTNTTVTTTTSNPFVSQTLTVSSSPFGGSGLTSQGSIFSSTQSATPFSNSPFASVQKEVEMLDENVYTIEEYLTDDEKVWYSAKQFMLGRIPLKAPSKELR